MANTTERSMQIGDAGCRYHFCSNLFLFWSQKKEAKYLVYWHNLLISVAYLLSIKNRANITAVFIYLLFLLFSHSQIGV